MEPEDCPDCPKPTALGETISRNGTNYISIAHSDTDATPEWAVNAGSIKSIEFISPKVERNKREQIRQQNIDAVRQRYYNAIANCEVCQEVKSLERMMFMYIPMTVATGGLSLKGTLKSSKYKFVFGTFFSILS